MLCYVAKIANYTKFATQFFINGNDPPPLLRGKLIPIFLLENASFMAETDFTIGPISKTNKFPL